MGLLLSKTLRIAEPSLPFLHDDIIIDNILIRLSVKTVGRFRCVSKQWRSLLSSPRFTKSHLNFHTHIAPECSIFIETEPHGLTIFTVNLANERNIVFKKLTISSSMETWRSSMETWRLAGSCHGLVLAIHRKRSGVWSFNLFNPITLETLEIPGYGADYWSYGLGYDNLLDDYKIVSLSRYKPDVRIYSVKMKTWSSLIIHVLYKYIGDVGIFVNGCMHWECVTDKAGWCINIAAFNMAGEKFEELPLPSESIFWGFTLTVLVGCLALRCERWGTDYVDYWVMKEYGVGDSWTKYTITLPKNRRVVREVCVSGEDEIVVIVERSDGGGEEELVACNWRNGGVRRNLNNAELPRINDLHCSRNFRESLISPKSLTKSGAA